MTTTADMSTPVTRGELREELEQLEIRFDRKIEQLVTRGELREELEQLEIRFDRKIEQLVTREQLEQLEVRVDSKLELWGGALRAQILSGEQRMIAELARHAKAIQEAVASQISVIDEKYADLPRRVRRLEAAVFEPEPR